MAASTLRAPRLGASFARNLLNIETPKTVKTCSRLLLKEIPTEIEMEELTPREQKEVIDKVVKNVSTNTDLDMREMLGLDNALQRIKGELENNVSKLSEIDKHIAKEQQKLAEIDKDPSLEESRHRVLKRLNEFKEERLARREIISQNTKELSSQFSRIRQSIE